MSVDRPPKRQTVSKRDAVPPENESKKKRPKSRTADNLEALLHMLDEDGTSDAALTAGRKSPAMATRRTPRPAGEQSPAAGEPASFLQELARARADLHKQRGVQTALQEEVASLRNELARLATAGSKKVDELRCEAKELHKQLASLQLQRRRLKDALLDSEAEVEAVQQQREQLHDHVDLLTRQLAEAAAAKEQLETRVHELETELATSQRLAAADQRKTASQVQQVNQELEMLRQRLADIEQGPASS